MIFSDDQKDFFWVKNIKIALVILKFGEVVEWLYGLGDQRVGRDVGYLHILEMNTIVSILSLL